MEDLLVTGIVLLASLVVTTLMIGGVIGLSYYLSTSRLKEVEQQRHKVGQLVDEVNENRNGREL